MKIDELLILREKSKLAYIDSDKAEKLKFAYKCFLEGSFIRKLFYYFTRYDDYSELSKEYESFARYVESWNNNYLRCRANKFSVFFESLGDIELNNQQKDIVLADEKRLMALAGAGSGKTLTIAVKVKYLVDILKIKPENILLLAFTRKAAGEMSERLQKKFGVCLKASTFHSLGYKIISEATGEKIRVLDSSEKIFESFFEKYVGKDIVLRNKISKFLEYSPNIAKKESKWLSKLTQTFINLLKSSDEKISSIRERYAKNQLLSSRDKVFLDIAEAAQKFYGSELKRLGLIDFNDMVIKAAKCIENMSWKPFYNYVIIDEYQDISFSRYKLIKSVVDASNASLICVGDDWQSIYRFTGSDIDLITNFQKYWGNFRHMRIERNYRNTQENINITAGFVLKNKRQLAKQLVSDKHTNEPFVAIYYGSPSNGQATNLGEALIQALGRINQVNSSKEINILLLGRNNADINAILVDGKMPNGIDCVRCEEDVLVTCRQFPNLKIKFLTIHRAKGLEADYVVLLNLKSGMTGFPNKISDDDVMRFVLAAPDEYEYAEERRLFYVALTRGKAATFLLVPDRKESCFVKELFNVGT